MRSLSAAAALACLALFAGCGSGHGRQTTTSALPNPFHLGPVYGINVYFCNALSMPGCSADATRGEEHLVETHLRTEACVKRIVFTSKAKAFAEFKKEHPKLVGAMPAGVGNPLPDSYLVTLDKPSCAAAIYTAARAAHWPGVEQIRLARRRPTPAGS